MSQRLPSLLNRSIKFSGIRSGAQQKHATSIRSYATHQEQDAKPPSSSTPLIVAGLLVAGGYMYYSSSKGTRGNKEPDPSDVAGQKFQKKADQEITKRTDAQDSVDLRGQSPSTIQNENKELAGHPMATKKDAYVDPSREAKQTSGAGSLSDDLKEGAQEQWDKAKQEADRTMQSLEGSAQDAKDKADSVMGSVQQAAEGAKNQVQAAWNQVSTTASDRVDETQQAVSNTKDQAKNEWNRVSTDASNKVEQAKDQANAVWNQASSDASEKMNQAKSQAKDTYKEAQSQLDSVEQKANEKAADIKDGLKK